MKTITIISVKLKVNIPNFKPNKLHSIKLWLKTAKYKKTVQNHKDRTGLNLIKFDC